MKIITSRPIILSHEEITILSQAHDILEKIAEDCADADVCGLACAITDCLDVLAQCYIEEDY